MADLSIVIPSRNEMFLARTIENILSNIEGDTEIIAVLDGAWAEPRIVDNPKVTVLHYSESIGQRAAANQAVKLSKAKYVMKCDAHCAFDKAFDVKMLEAIKDHHDWTMVPVMKNLHAFDWVCPEGHRRYQGPSGPCQVCGKETKRDILWQAKPSPNSVSYCFDSTPHFQYFGAYAKRPEGQGEITETMSLQGSCWMLTREKYWELDICDENFGSWGSQGIEVAVKTWLSGGRVMVNKKTWYAHLFRTQGGDFSFPYPIKGSDQEKAKTFARDLFFNNKWPLQKRPLSWLVEKFWPVPGWTDEDLKKLKANTFRFSGSDNNQKPAESEPVEALEDNLANKIIYHANEPTKRIIYYTDNALKLKIASNVQRQLAKISAEKGISITSSSVKKMAFGQASVNLPDLKPGSLTTLKLILNGLENCDAEIVFLCANNVLYHQSHFDFTPPDKNTIYYNQNVWFLRTTDGHALHYDANQLSGLCGHRDTLISYFKKTLAELKIGIWRSEGVNIDIRYEANINQIRWRKDQFRNQKYTNVWTESDTEIPDWGKITDLLKTLV